VFQGDVLALLGVAQSTISRWEAGRQAMEPAERLKVETVVSARLDTAADRVLATLVSESPRVVHLMCDLTHRLLACSSARANEFGVPARELMGRTLLLYATAEINVVEEALADRGWYDQSAPSPFEFETGANDSRIVPIWQSRCRWTRLLLSDGTPARLVETISRSRRSSAANQSAPSAV
jgi:transcriptional regulator with XRE-family HTH domain